ncbi:MAG: c-type cytochrome [Rubricella sp.]
MRKVVWVVAILCVAGLAFAYWGRDAGSANAGGFLPHQDRAMVALGAEVYAAQCAACHGVNLEGEANWRVRGADGLMPAPPHDETGHTWHHPDEVLFMLTKYGPEAVIGGGYRSAMPAYEGILSDEAIVAVLAYIKSTWPEEVRTTHDQINERAAANR